MLGYDFHSIKSQSFLTLEMYSGMNVDKLENLIGCSIARVWEMELVRVEVVVWRKFGWDGLKKDLGAYSLFRLFIVKLRTLETD